MTQGPFQRTQNDFVKQLLVLFVIILVLIPVVKAEEKSWYEVDGIRIRYGQSGPFVHIAIPKGSESYIDILKASKEIKSHQRDSGAGEFPYENPMIPLAIEWPEALMGKYSCIVQEPK